MIKKVRIGDFKCLHDREIDLTRKVTVLHGPNGSGKTSVIEAICYALFGLAPKGDILVGNSHRKVELFIDDDIIEREYTGKLNKCRLNGKDIQTKLLDDYILKTYFEGCNPEMAKLMLTPEKEISSQGLMTYLTAYLNEKLTMDKLKKFIPDESKNLIPALETYAEFSLPAEFSLDELAEFAEGINTLRKNAAAEMKTLQSTIKTLENAAKEPSQPEISVDEKEKLQKEIERLTKEKKQLEDSIRNAEEAYNKNYTHILGIKSELEKSAALIKKLSGDTCPLCDKLKCSTDKTPIKKELEGSMETMKSSALVLKKNCETFRANAESNRAELENVAATLSNATLKLRLAEEKREPANAASLDAIRTKYEEVSRDAEEKKALYELLRPDGVVKQNVLDYYLDTFNDFLNGLAKEYNDKYSYKLIKNKGIQVYVKSEHSKETYVALDELSTGEKVVAVYFLLMLLCELSGTVSCISIDSAESLDITAAQALSGVIKKSNLVNVFMTCCNEQISSVFGKP